MTLEEKIETLFKIITELHARETTFNCVVKDLFDKIQRGKRLKKEKGEYYVMSTLSC